MYKDRVKSIKQELHKYSDSSFITIMLSVFNEGNSKVDFLQRLPWACFLAYKWKLIEPAGNKKINRTQFSKIINRIHHLQSYASNINSQGKIDLKIRPLLINQALYQTPFKEQMHSILRQYYWFVTGDGFFDDAFKKISSLSIKKYYEITYWLMLYAHIQRKQSFSIQLSEILIFLHPYCSIEEIINYLNFVSCSINNLREYAQQHTQIEAPSWEYFSDTPFIYKPILISDSKAIIYNKHLLHESLSNLVVETLKFNLKESFKSKFSIAMELYIQNIFQQYELNFYTETKIKDIYSKNSISKSKVVDFIIREDDSNIYIDAKAIEPGIIVKTESDPQILRKRLTASFIKGIIQTQACAKNLIDNDILQRNENDIALIVLHKDHFIANADDLIKDIDTKLPERLKEKNSDLYIDLSKTYYITINDLEKLIEYCYVNNIKISSLIKKISTDDKAPQTKKYIFNMHIQELDGDAGDLYYELRTINNELGGLFEKIHNTKNSFWSGKIPYYLDCYKRLMKSYT